MQEADAQMMRAAESRSRVPDVIVITGMSGSGPPCL